MTEGSSLLVALAVGVLLGAIFFGGLWWTVVRGIGSRFAALWFIISLLLRTSVAMAGFYLVGRGSWGRLVACLVGFIVARLIVTRLSAGVALRSPSARRASHAP